MRDDDPDHPMWGRNRILEDILYGDGAAVPQAFRGLQHSFPDAGRDWDEDGWMAEDAPIPPFTRCPACGGVSMRIVPGQPVRCAGCGFEK